MSITMVACVDMQDGIGNENGELLFDFPKDKAMFRSVTGGKHVVMGRKTWDSLPKKPLPKRKNYVLTRDESFEVKGKTKVLNTIEEVLELAKSKEIFIIGGQEIYEQFMPHADKLIMTFVHGFGKQPTSFFPEINLSDWKMVKSQRNEKDEKHFHSFTFTTYKRKQA